MVERLWWQGLEATDHMASAVRKQQEMNARAQLMNSFLGSPEASPWNGMMLPKLMVFFPAFFLEGGAYFRQVFSV